LLSVRITLLHYSLVGGGGGGGGGGSIAANSPSQSFWLPIAALLVSPAAPEDLPAKALLVCCCEVLGDKAFFAI
jgi:hypothetical protein